MLIKSCSGASFVGRDTIIWGKSLTRNQNGDYIKSIAILDGDNAGNEAKREIERVIIKDSAESKIFKVIQLSKKVAKHIIPLYTQGLQIPITFEELFIPIYWQHAEAMGWLEKRQSIDELLSNPRAWDKFNVSLKDHIAGLNLPDDEVRYTLKFKREKKDAFRKYLITLKEDQRKIAYQSIKYIIDEALLSLSLIRPSLRSYKTC